MSQLDPICADAFGHTVRYRAQAVRRAQRSRHGHHVQVSAHTAVRAFKYEAAGRELLKRLQAKISDQRCNARLSRPEPCGAKIDPGAGDVVGQHPAANALASFDHQYVAAGGDERVSNGEADNAGADDKKLSLGLFVKVDQIICHGIGPNLDAVS